jgi:hypothetical protein
MRAAIVPGLIAAAATIIAAIVAGIFLLASTWSGKESPTSGSGSTAAAISTTCQGGLRITSPGDGDTFTSGIDKVLTIAGTDCALGSDTGWLVEYDHADKYYYLDYNGSVPAPVVQSSHAGTWSFPDVAIGDAGDQKQPYTIMLVLASKACAKLLATTPQIDGDYKLRSIPSVCTIADQRIVYVTYPSP